MEINESNILKYRNFFNTVLDKAHTMSTYDYSKNVALVRSTIHGGIIVQNYKDNQRTIMNINFFGEQSISDVLYVQSDKNKIRFRGTDYTRSELLEDMFQISTTASNIEVLCLYAVLDLNFKSNMFIEIVLDAFEQFEVL